MRISDWSSDVCSSDLDWRPFAYVRNHILINELTSPLVVLVRPPEMKPVPSDPDAPLLPDLDIDVGNLTVDRLLIGRAVTGRTHELSLEGETHIADGRARLAANAQALGGDRLTLRLDASRTAEHKSELPTLMSIS